MPRRTPAENRVIRAATLYMRAHQRHGACEGELANGGRDCGVDEWAAKKRDTHDELEEALDALWGGNGTYDLRDPPGFDRYRE